MARNLNFRVIVEFGFIVFGFDHFGFYVRGGLVLSNEDAHFVFSVSDMAEVAYLGTFTLSPPFSDTIAFSVVLLSSLK